MAALIKEGIQKGENNQVLDRLHTFVIKYIRALCSRHNIPFDQNTFLHSLFGGYRKYLVEKGIIESEMADRILKSFIGILEAFNGVRNNQSFAHDNPILNTQESTLIVNNIASMLNYISYIESTIPEEDSSFEVIDEINEEEIEAAADSWIQLNLDDMRGK